MIGAFSVAKKQRHKWSGKGDSNSRPRPWQGRALPAELFPLSCHKKVHAIRASLNEARILIPIVNTVKLSVYELSTFLHNRNITNLF